MIPHDQLSEFLDGARPDLEAAVVIDVEALDMVAVQQQIAAALRVMFATEAEQAQLRQGVLAVVGGASPAALKSRVLAATPRRKRRVRWWWWGLLAAAAGAMTGTWLSTSQHREKQLPADLPVVVTKPSITAVVPWVKPVATKVNAPERDWMRWPFVESSPWNRRLPADAVTASCVLTGAASLTHSDLMVPVFVGNPAAQKFPWEFRPVVLILESNQVFELRGVVAGVAGGLEAVRIWTNDLRGTGICAEQMCGPRRSGMSALGGLIRVGEVRTEIRHALAITVPVEALARPRWVWPASAAFGLPPEDVAAEGNLYLGSLVMLPADVDVSELGSLGKALQEYGAYVVDAHFEADYQVGFFVERGVPDELPADVDAQVSRWLLRLRVVENNRP